MADVVANGVRHHVQRLGRGDRTVVFVHGLVMDNLSSWYFTVANPVAAEPFGGFSELPSRVAVYVIESAKHGAAKPSVPSKAHAIKSRFIMLILFSNSRAEVNYSRQFRSQSCPLCLLGLSSSPGSCAQDLADNWEIVSVLRHKTSSPCHPEKPSQNSSQTRGRQALRATSRIKLRI